MYGILPDFIYWLNSNILSFYNGISTPQKSLFLHTFSRDLSLFSFVKKEGNSSKIITVMFWCYSS